MIRLPCYAFCGKMQVGKTTAAKVFCAELVKKEYTPIIFPFAYSLKLYTIQYFGIEKEKMFSGQKEDAIRNLLQGLGSFIRNEVNSNFWITKNEELIKQYFSTNISTSSVVLIDDLRYENELRWVRSTFKQSFITHILRDLPDKDDNELGNHESELECETLLKAHYEGKIGCKKRKVFDYLLINNGTIEEYAVKVRELLEGNI